ncbi:hypothetical protein BH09PSE4_BH09PSE4_01950 [soil metagenome]
MNGGRLLHKECCFGGTISDETRREAYERLLVGLDGCARIATCSPYVLGPGFSAADCAAYVHFTMIRLATTPYVRRRDGRTCRFHY